MTAGSAHRGKESEAKQDIATGMGALSVAKLLKGKLTLQEVYL